MYINLYLCIYVSVYSSDLSIDSTTTYNMYMHILNCMLYLSTLQGEVDAVMPRTSIGGQSARSSYSEGYPKH
jgi:hypothetical protein